MDSTDTLRLETNSVREENRQANHRRGDPEGDLTERTSSEGGRANWSQRSSGQFQDMSRYYEEIGDDLRRRERMAEAMYEC